MYTNKMGCDWDIVSEDGEVVSSVFRSCSSNFHDIRQRYNIDMSVIHGQTGLVVMHYLSQAVASMYVKGVRDFSNYSIHVLFPKNSNWNWGVDMEGNDLEDSLRERILMHQLMEFISVAAEFPFARWYGDQINSPHMEYSMNPELIMESLHINTADRT